MADEKVYHVELLDLIKQDAGLGFEEMSGQDFGAPFLQILQGQSPQVMEGNPLYVEGARPGLIINTQSQNAFKEVTVIPVRYTFKVVEWKQRTAGGGFVKSYSRGEEPADIVVDALTGRLSRQSNGNNLVQTSYHLVMVKEENWDKAIIPMFSTQLKKSRRWNSVMASYRIDETKTAPMFSHYFKLSTAQEKNSLGAWYGWVINPAGPVEDVSLYSSAKEAFEKNVNFLPERLIAQINGGHDKEAF